jgi:putative endonuclease
VKNFTSQSQKTGEIGENIASRYLESKGFKIIERNYTEKWGEIDIVAQKKGEYHFVEVKSVVRDNLDGKFEGVRPEENMHEKKMERMGRIVQTYLSNRNISEDTEWQCDLVCVYLDVKGKKAKVEVLENIIL